MTKKEDSFLPKDYSVPSSSDFMSFENGENTFRVMSPVVFGFEYWTKENKPKRSKVKWTTTPADIKLDKDGNPTAIKHFWAIVVWNYKDKAIQSLEITQKTIMDSIVALSQNTKWGNPMNYDLTVNKEGEGLKTKYSVQPNPHSEVTEEMTAEFVSKNIDLETLFKDDGPSLDEVMS
jgi:hypothetical protein